MAPICVPQFTSPVRPSMNGSHFPALRFFRQIVRGTQMLPVVPTDLRHAGKRVFQTSEDIRPMPVGSCSLQPVSSASTGRPTGEVTGAATAKPARLSSR